MLCKFIFLVDGFTSFRRAYPEWCEEECRQMKELESSRNTQADQLMGLRCVYQFLLIP